MRAILGRPRSENESHSRYRGYAQAPPPLVSCYRHEKHVSFRPTVEEHYPWRMAPRIPSSTKRLIVEEADLRRSGHPDGLTRAEIANKYGVSVPSVGNIINSAKSAANPTQRSGQVAKLRMESGQFPDPLDYDDLCGEAQRSLEDIEFFSLRYFGIQLLPWQLMSAQRVVELLETPHEEYAVVNVAPGSGKSRFFGGIIPAWLSVRDRSLRGMFGSATNLGATKLCDALRTEFVRPHYPNAKLSEKDKRDGLELRQSSLAQDFGRFRPEVDGSLWTRSEFEIAQLSDVFRAEKEPSWFAFGKDSTFIGWRAEFVLWDDAWDVRKLRTATSVEDFYEWWDTTAETRLEPGGLFLQQGQRLQPNDISNYCLQKRMELTNREIEELGGQDNVPMRYHHFVFKAWDDSHPKATDEDFLDIDSPPWPEGPLLSPRRIPWRRLNSLRSNKPDEFNLVYQQDDRNLVGQLVSELWVNGGVDETGELLPGCQDAERRMGEIPEGLEEPLISVAMTDPSGTNRWGHIWYLWQPAMEPQKNPDGQIMSSSSEDVRHLIRCQQGKMSADLFLDWNNATQTFYGLMEDWWQESNEKGRPIRWWIVEQNAAQRYLLQFEHTRRWMSTRGVTILGHDTHRNKSDEKLGVTATIPPVWRRGLIRLPYGDVAIQGPGKRFDLVDFTKQFLDYPGGTHDDLVMASWFFENKKDVMRPAQRQREKQSRPAFMKTLETKGRGVLA